MSVDGSTSRVGRHEDRDALSRRELDVLRLMAQGLSAAQAGEALCVSAATVRTHHRHIYDKLGVRCAPAAVFQAIRRGVLET